MDRPKVLLISANGQVGLALYNVLREKNFSVTGTWFDINDPNLIFVDIGDKESVKDVFEKTCPDIVILNAALTNVEFCEEHSEAAARINVQGVRNVAEFCKEYNSKMIFFSSDYVFDGVSGPYSEEDAVCPVNVYGKQKVEGEKIVREFVQDFLIVRTTVVYGKDIAGKNFAVRLIKSLQNGDIVRVPQDQIGTPTFTLHLAESVVALLEKKITGIYNVVGSDLMSRYDFALRVADIFRLDRALIQPVITSELNQLAKRPLNAGLGIGKLCETLKLQEHVFSVENGLRQLKEVFYE